MFTAFTAHLQPPANVWRSWERYPPSEDAREKQHKPTRPSREASAGTSVFSALELKATLEQYLDVRDRGCKVQGRGRVG